MADVTSKLKWLKTLLESLDVHQPCVMSLYCDSMSALHIAQNSVFYERTNHIEVDCHYVRDAICDGIITARHVVTHGNLRIFSLRPLANDNFYSC